MANVKDSLERARKSIESAIEAAEEERRRKMMNQRLELARAGINAFKNKQLATAVKSFQTYLRMLEELKGVNEGGLSPACFDIQQDLPELLMISGVYWDLLTIYDHTKSDARTKDFHHLLEKYIAFSKGMPYQSLCAETVRKYLTNNRPRHKREFKEAYRMLALNANKCFVATSLADVISPQTIPLLREFRDSHLRKSHLGRLFVFYYYQLGQKLVRPLDRLPEYLRRILGSGLDLLAFAYLRYKDKALSFWKE